MEKKRGGNSIKSIAALAVAAFLALGGVPVRPFVTEAHAASKEPVTYLYYASQEDAIARKTTIASAECTVVTSEETAWTNGWYVVKNSVDINSRITVTGTVNLILCDNTLFKPNVGITVNDGNKLNIYAQPVTGNVGKMRVSSVDDNNAGIGSETNKNCGEITINGGEIEATGGEFGGAGIGGGKEKNGGTITINGGKITASGGYNNSHDGGAGIGGGANGAGGEITINGGEIEATGGNSGLISGGAGIGGGANGAGGEITINGGEIKANPEFINSSDSCGAGIGGGAMGKSGTIRINGGTITANGGIVGAGIGGGYQGNGETITINGGKITATGYQGAGIGGGCYFTANEGTGGRITINGGEITAESTYGGAGIGIGSFASPGNEGTGGTITILGGKVTTKATDGGVGIGGGVYCKSNGSLALENDMYLLGGDAENPKTVIEMKDSDYVRSAYMTVKEREKANVTFKVINGSWNNGSASEIVKTIIGLPEKVPVLSAGDIPAVGANPGSGYKEGSWDTVPTAGAEITKDSVFTYTYALDPDYEEKKIDEDKKDAGFTVTLDKTSYTYDGKAKKPKVTVKNDGVVVSSKNYTVKYIGSRQKPGTYKVTVTGKGAYKGKTATATFTISKGTNPLKVTAKKPTVKTSSLAKKAQTLPVSRLVTVKKNQGKVSYNVTSDTAGITYDSKKKKLTLPKDLPAGTYPVEVTVTAAGNVNYLKGEKTVTVNITVK